LHERPRIHAFSPSQYYDAPPEGDFVDVIESPPTSIEKSTVDSGAVERMAPGFLMRDQSTPVRPLDDPDRELVACSVAGDRSAFAVLLERHYDRIHRVAWRLTGSDADAQDIAQEVCCTLVEKIDTFKGEAKFTTWLTGIVVNACRDHHRRNARWTRVKGGLAVLAGLARQPDGRDLYRQNWLTSGLSRLKPLLRETFVLVVREDMTHAEAAHALGVAESTVSWRIHEARKELDAQFNGAL